jgi:hypothetical protein
MPYPSSSVSQPKQMELVPFDLALSAYRDLPEHMKTSRFDPRLTESALDCAEPYSCPVCGGFRFVRMAFPIGHQFFGAAICCPRCWPQPFGHAKIGRLTQRQQQVAQMWGL